MFEFYTDKFKDFTVSSDKTVNEAIKNAINNNDSFVDLKIYLLTDILVLIEKAILNKLSSDIQFQKNYWTWGFVTVYYSNFYLAQILNRLSDKFFVYIDDNFNKAIQFDSNYNLYDLTLQKDGNSSHEREFKILQKNYERIKPWKVNNANNFNVIANAIKINIPAINLFKYTIDNEIKESKIRNEINYQLKHYKEINLESKNLTIYKKWYDDIIVNNKVNSHYPDYFQLLIINEKRFLFLSILLNEIKAINPAFKIKIQRLEQNINKKYNTTFHNVNKNTRKLIGELLK
jgi:hypothetical protein